MSTNDNTLTPAQALQRSIEGLGIPVVPMFPTTESGDCSCRQGAECEKPGKHPNLKDFYNRPIRSFSDAVAWAQKKRKAGLNPPAWAGLTGSEAGVLVIDVDGEEGRLNLDDLLASHPELPRLHECVRVNSGNGFHLWFAVPQGEPVDVFDVLPGVELKGDRRTIHLPGSLHRSGTRYWFDDAGDEEDWGDRDELPSGAAWLDLCSSLKRRTTNREGRFQMPEIVGEGERNTVLYAYGWHWMRSEVGSLDGLEAELSHASRANLSPPLSEKEVRDMAKGLRDSWIRIEGADSGKSSPAKSSNTGENGKTLPADTTRSVVGARLEEAATLDMGSSGFGAPDEELPSLELHEELAHLAPGAVDVWRGESPTNGELSGHLAREVAREMQRGAEATPFSPDRVDESTEAAERGAERQTSFPWKILPFCMQGLIEDAWDLDGIPPDIMGPVLLGVGSFLASGRYSVGTTAKSQPLCLSFVSVADVGGGKSRAMSLAAGYLRNLHGARSAARIRDLEKEEGRKKALSSIQSRITSAEGKLAELESAINKGDFSAKDESAHRATKAKLETLKSRRADLEVGQRLPNGSGVYADFTPEAVQSHVSRSGGFGLILTSEGAKVLDNLSGARYGTVNTGAVDLLVEGFDGELLQIDRVARGEVVIPALHLSLTTTTQPDVADRYWSNSEFHNRGLTSRLLWNRVPPQPKQPWSEETARKRPAWERWEDVCRYFSHNPVPWDWSHEAEEGLTFQDLLDRYIDVVEVEPVAWQLFQEFDGQCAQQVAGEGQEVQGALQRVPVWAIRIAALFAIFDRMDEALEMHPDGLRRFPDRGPVPEASNEAEARYQAEHWDYVDGWMGKPRATVGVLEMARGIELAEWYRDQTRAMLLVGEATAAGGDALDELEAGAQVIAERLVHVWKVDPAKAIVGGGRGCVVRKRAPFRRTRATTDGRRVEDAEGPALLRRTVAFMAQAGLLERSVGPDGQGRRQQAWVPTMKLLARHGVSLDEKSQG